MKMRLIVVDGLDGAGKDTHALLIKERYESRGEAVVLRSHPETDNLFGRRAKRALLGHGKTKMLLASIFYAMDVLRSVRRYKRGLDTLIMVRYIGGVAYLPPVLGRPLYRLFFTILPTSEYMFFLDAEPEVSLARIETRSEREMFESLEQLEKIRNRARPLLDSWHIIDTHGSIEDVHSRIVEILDRLDEQDGT